MFSAMAVAAMLLAETTPAAAPPAAAAPGGAVSPAIVTAPAKAGTLEADKLICKNEPVMGSRMTKKVCYSAAEQAMQKQDQRMNLERMQAQSDHR
jgi:hypothetical protein